MSKSVEGLGATGYRGTCLSLFRPHKERNRRYSESQVVAHQLVAAAALGGSVRASLRSSCLAFD